MFEHDGLPSAVISTLTGKAKRKQGERYDYVTYQNEYRYAGMAYPINSAKSGCYTLILQRIIEQVTSMVALYRRVLFVRFELHHQHPEPTSKRISTFIESTRKFVMRRYRTQHMGFLWVREQEKAKNKNQHYHLILMLDGDKIRHPDRLFDELAEAWGRKGGAHWKPKNPFIFIDKPELVAKAVKRASYLAKARGKGYRPDGVRDFGCSRIKQNPTTAQ